MWQVFIWFVTGEILEGIIRCFYYFVVLIRFERMKVKAIVAGLNSDADALSAKSHTSFSHIT